jgi:hypothetical protein
MTSEANSSTWLFWAKVAAALSRCDWERREWRSRHWGVGGVGVGGGGEGGGRREEEEEVGGEQSWGREAVIGS